MIRLFQTAALFLPVFGAHAGVSFTNLFAFNGTNGYSPAAELAQAIDGNFYGTTGSGGSNNMGTVFRITTNGALTTLYSFGQVQDGQGNPIDGGWPMSALAQDSDGSFYGTTSGGGSNNCGTVFKITTNGALTTLHSFKGSSEGYEPMVGLAQGSDCNFYGVTEMGGTNGYGTLFKIMTNGTFALLHTFAGTDGLNPYTAGLVCGLDGNLYGATIGGGTNGGVGTVFEITTNGALATLHTFTGHGDGANPKAGVVQGSDGSLYGTTQSGGSNNLGTVFRITTNGTLTYLASFNRGNGAYPMARLVQATDGNFYGTTLAGGTNGDGTVFRITPGGTLTSLYSFTSGSSTFFGGLVQGSDGSFYGMLPYGAGSVFRLTVVPPAAPAFLSITQTNDMLTLTWSTEPQATYQVQYCADLCASDWMNLGDCITATGAMLSVTDSVTNSAGRLYRVALLPSNP